ncbi:hypothetical protein GLOIN_2v1720033 [Rhizophagus clarus]|nr:hypothetical protein GLOIN_2v1720033 [Rhizophagus clarus]
MNTVIARDIVSFRGAIEAAKRSARAGTCSPKVSDSLAMPLQQRNFEDAMHMVDEALYSNIMGRTEKSNYWCLVSGEPQG